jgi:AraC-like DNA-binding protein
MADHKRLTLSEVKRVLVLRHAGYSIATIAATVGCSARTVSRICQRFGVVRSDFRKEAIERAKADLLNDAAFVDTIKTELRALALDTTHQIRAIRERIGTTLEVIEADNLESGAVAARALAALSTSLRLSVDTLKSIDTSAQGAEELPQLVIGVMGAEEIEAAKAANREGNEGGELDDEEIAELFDGEG